MKNIIDFIEDILNKFRASRVKKFVKINYKIILIIILAVFLYFGYIFGQSNNSKERFILNIQEILKTEDSKKLSKVVRLNGRRVESRALEPLMLYYNDVNRISATINKLLDCGETETFTIASKEGLFGDEYYLNLKTYSLTVNTNFIEGLFTIDDNNYIEGGESFESLIPGVYTIKGKLSSEYGDIEQSKEVLLVDNEETTINFNAINVSITSKFLDAEVFVNDEKINKTVREINTLGPFPTDGSVSLNIENEFPWGLIASEKVQVTDIPNITINLDMNNTTLENVLTNITEEFYESVFEALNNEDKDKINNSTFAAKDKIYDVLEKKYIFLKNKYNVEHIDIINDKNEYYYENNTYKATIVVKIDYYVEKSLFGLDKTLNSKMFFTKLIYDGNNWKVDNVENFSL